MIRQIDYKTPRTLRSLNGKKIVRLTGRETRYHFEGVLVDGEPDNHTAIGETRKDWLKSAFPLPWSDDGDFVDGTEPRDES